MISNVFSEAVEHATGDADPRYAGKFYKIPSFIFHIAFVKELSQE